jgi:hypothetical protein
MDRAPRGEPSSSPRREGAALSRCAEKRNGTERGSPTATLRRGSVGLCVNQPVGGQRASLSGQSEGRPLSWMTRNGARKGATEALGTGALPWAWPGAEADQRRPGCRLRTTRTGVPINVSSCRMANRVQVNAIESPERLIAGALIFGRIANRGAPLCASPGISAVSAERRISAISAVSRGKTPTSPRALCTP